MQEYLQKQPRLTYELQDLHEILTSETVSEEVVDYLRTSLKVPEFLLKKDLLRMIAHDLCDEHHRLYDTEDLAIGTDADGKIQSIRPEKRLPVYYVDQCEKLLSTLSDDRQMMYVESVVSGDTIQVLYTHIAHEMFGGVVFFFNRDTSAVSARRYIKSHNMYLYLPSKYYSKSTGRYDRYTDSYRLSLETMLQRILLDIETNSYLESLEVSSDSINDTDLLSLEEVSTIVSSTHDHDSVTLLDPYREDSDFDDKYYDYLWRCSNIKTSVSAVLGYLSSEDPEVLSGEEFRSTLGSILTGSKIRDRLYKE